MQAVCDKRFRQVVDLSKRDASQPQLIILRQLATLVVSTGGFDYCAAKHDA
jgi:hypothetical protein